MTIRKFLANASTAAFAAVITIAAGTVTAQSLGEFVVTKMAEKQVDVLPEGDLYWHVENFPSLQEATAAAGAHSLAGEFDGKAWLFTLADRSSGGSGGTPVASIGPVPRFDSDTFLLRVNNATAPVGAKTSVHSHPGPEAFLVLSGQLSQHTPLGMHVLNAGATMPGVPDQPMEIHSTGDEELRELIMFVVDPSRPFAEEANLN